MKLRTLIITVFVLCLISFPAAFAQEASLDVTTAIICADVVDRMPVDEGASFSASVGKLYCFTKIEGAQDPLEISHVWYFGNIERAKVPLSVRSSSWRTFSSKRIQAHEVGQWFVDVEGPDGQVLKTIQFKVTP
jgi:hypothetical protein